MERHRRRQITSNLPSEPTSPSASLIDIVAHKRANTKGRPFTSAKSSSDGNPNELMTEGESAGKPFTAQVLHRQPVREGEPAERPGELARA